MGNDKKIDDDNIVQFVKMKDRIDKLEDTVDELLKMLRRANIQNDKANKRVIDKLKSEDSSLKLALLFAHYLEEDSRSLGHIIAYTGKYLVSRKLPKITAQNKK